MDARQKDTRETGRSDPSADLLVNYRLYRARSAPRTWLVVSTFLAGEHPDREHFGDPVGLRELMEELISASRLDTWHPDDRIPVTLRTHGYNTRLGTFEKQMIEESRNSPRDESLRPDDRFYIGFRWPSEGLLSVRSLLDTTRALLFGGLVGMVLIALPLLGLSGEIARAVETLASILPPVLEHLLRLLVAPFLSRPAAATLLGAGLALLGMRLSTYLQDRYRAIHYGVADLNEFIRDLETGLSGGPRTVRLALDSVGHSMGCLLLVSAFRVLSEVLHFPTKETAFIGASEAIELRTLLMCAPDLPVALAQWDRNNYFLASLRRFASVHVLCSDRDIVLKWASTVANWAQEPHQEMAGRRLGNLLLTRARPRGLEVGGLTAMTRPILRNFRLTAEAPPFDAHTWRAWVQLHDCTACRSLAGREGLIEAVSALGGALLLGLVLRSSHPALLWPLTVLGSYCMIGSLARLLWLVAREVPGVGSLLGYFADWPSVFQFLPGMHANPHGGYFESGGEPRRLMARLLAAPPARLDPYAGEPELPNGFAPIRSEAIALPVGRWR